jgi:hypothetical protein
MIYKTGIDPDINYNKGLIQCRHCGKYVRNIVGKTRVCVACHNAVIRAGQKGRQKAARSKSGKVSNITSVLKVRISSAISSDLAKGRLVERPDLTMNYLLDLYYQQRGRCALTGVELSLKPAMGRRPDKNLLSLDRIDISKPHARGNVRFVTYQANVARHDGTDEELLEFCWNVITHFHNKAVDSGAGSPLDNLVEPKREPVTNSLAIRLKNSSDLAPGE